jgi:hypothetical protein
VNLLSRNQRGGGAAKGRPVRGTPQAALLAIVLFAGGVACACDPIFVLRGSVSISPTLQSSFSPEQPGRLVIVARHQGGGFPHISWATLCEPTAVPLVVPFVLQKTGCAKETVVQARLERVVATGTDVPTCGSRGQVVSIRDDALVASVEQTLLVGASGCDSANVEVNLAF